MRANSALRVINFERHAPLSSFQGIAQVFTFDELDRQEIVLSGYERGMDLRNVDPAFSQQAQYSPFMSDSPETVAVIPVNFPVPPALLQHAKSGRSSTEIDCLIDAAFPSLTQRAKRSEGGS